MTTELLFPISQCSAFIYYEGRALVPPFAHYSFDLKVLYHEKKLYACSHVVLKILNSHCPLKS